MTTKLSVDYIEQLVDERANRLREQNRERGGSVRVSSLIEALIEAWQSTNEELVAKIAELEDRIATLEGEK